MKIIIASLFIVRNVRHGLPGSFMAIEKPWGLFIMAFSKWDNGGDLTFFGLAIITHMVILLRFVER